MRRGTVARTAAAGPEDGFFGRPWVVLLAIGAALLVLGWQFVVDAARAVPAFDTAYYQWRVEYLLTHDPGSLIELRGATGALAGGYRVAEPVLGGLMRTVGGVADVTPTVVLSVLFRVLAAVGMAAFAWRHRRSWSLFYITLAAIPALFLLQRFFGYLDNFFTLSLLAGALLLLEPVRTSWVVRGVVTMFFFLAGLSHPTTLAIFILSIGALAVYRLIRERSIAAAWRSEGWVLVCGAVAVLLTAAFWLGGLWGPTSSFSDAAVPPPETVEFFVNRSLGVLGNMTPFLMVPLILLGVGHLLVTMWKDREPFAEVTLAWTLPLAGMFGFLLGAAYPYFRFFNATLAPLLAAALGLWLLIWLASKLRSPLASVAPIVAAAAVVAILALWWVKGLSAWNSTETWLTPEIRSQTAAMSAYLRAAPGGTRAVVLTDAQPGAIVPYGKYKEFANATYAGIDGDQIDDATLFFGTVEDLEAGQASASSDEPYNEISAETAREAAATLEGDAVVFAPAAFNGDSTNAEFLEACAEPDCLEVAEGLAILPELSSAPVDEGAVTAAQRAAEEAVSFATDPPGPFSDLGGTLLAIVRLTLLFLLPGFLLFLALPERGWVDGVALVPVLGISVTTTVGVFVVAVLREPFTDALGWLTWAVATVAAGALALIRRRRGPQRTSEAQRTAPAAGVPSP
jgi:hypothetical protein